MKLSAYLKERELTASEFASRIDRSISTVTRAARGEVMPDPETMRRIATETGGAVQPNDWYDIPTSKANTGLQEAGT